MLWPWEIPWREVLTRRFWLGEGEHRGILVNPFAAVARDPGAALSGAAIGAGAALAAAAAVKVTAVVTAAAAAKAAAAAAAAKSFALGTGLKAVLLWEAWQMADVGQEAVRAGIRRWEKAPYAPPAAPPGPVVRASSVPVSRPRAPAGGPGGWDQWSRIFARGA